MIYVDNVYIPARVGKFNSRWCHLMSDQLDPAELHAFAKGIGLRRAWFQSRQRDPAGDHYDVTEGKRWQAVKAGAVEIDAEGLRALMAKRRDLVRAGR